MAILVILFGSWILFRGAGALGITALATWQASACYALAVMFLLAGIAHFNKTRHDLVKMMPSVFPRPMTMIYITGVLELLGVMGLVLPAYRRLAGICLIALLLAMFPANVKAALEGLQLRGKPATALWLRVPMQILFIGLLWWSAVAR